MIASMTDAAGAARLAEKLRALMEVTHLGPAGAMTASFGVAEMRPDDTVEAMVAARRRGALPGEERRAQPGAVRRGLGGHGRWSPPARARRAKGLRRGPARPLYMDTGYGPIDVEHRELSEALVDFVPLVRGRDAGRGPPRPWPPGRGESPITSRTRRRSCGSTPTRPAPGTRRPTCSSWGTPGASTAELERNGVTPGFRQWAASRLPEWFRYHILAHDVALGQVPRRRRCDPVGGPQAGRSSAHDEDGYAVPGGARRGSRAWPRSSTRASRATSPHQSLPARALRAARRRGGAARHPHPAARPPPGEDPLAPGDDRTGYRADPRRAWPPRSRR